MSLREITSSVADLNLEQTFKLQTSLINDDLMIERAYNHSDQENYIIFDMTGQMVLRGQINQALTQIDFTQFRSGHYFIRFEKSQELHRFFKG